MPTVYRFEDAEGYGPYRSDTDTPAVSNAMWKHNFDDEHPSAMMDIPQFLPGLQLIACETLEKLDKWFTEDEQKLMLAHGYRVFAYEVEKFYESISGKQVSFWEWDVRSKVVVRASTKEKVA